MTRAITRRGEERRREYIEALGQLALYFPPDFQPRYASFVISRRNGYLARWSLHDGGRGLLSTPFFPYLGEHVFSPHLNFSFVRIRVTCISLLRRIVPRLMKIVMTRGINERYAEMRGLMYAMNERNLIYIYICMNKDTASMFQTILAEIIKSGILSLERIKIASVRNGNYIEYVLCAFMNNT